MLGRLSGAPQKPRAKRASTGGDLGPSSLREALRARGGTRSIVPSAPTDVEDNEPVEKSSLDWLNLTAFAPKALQNVVDKLRQGAGDSLPFVLARGDTGSLEKAARKGPDDVDDLSGLITPRAQSTPGWSLAGLGTSLSSSTSGLRSALQARGGVGRRSTPAMSGPPREDGEDVDPVPMSGPRSDVDGTGHLLSCSASLLPSVAEGEELDKPFEVAAMTPPSSPPQSPRTETEKLAAGVEKLERGRRGYAAPGSPCTEGDVFTDDDSGICLEQQEAALNVRLGDASDDNFEGTEALPSRGCQGVEHEGELDCGTAGNSRQSALRKAPRRTGGSNVGYHQEEAATQRGTLLPPAAQVAALLGPLAPIRRPDKVDPDIGKLRELREFWGAKSSLGFAGPQLGTSRLSKVEAQASLQRLIALGGDFDEVRRLRRFIRELELQTTTPPSMP